MYINDVLSMPDKWEYPWFATWDTAFHCIPLAMVDPAFAKKQLDLLTREWYMKPDGALPAYEWNFSDVNPPVHAWSTFRVFKIERKMFGREDLDFLERVFQKLLLNFTWCVQSSNSPDRAHRVKGGSTGRIRTATMCSKVASLVWIISGLLIGPSRCLLAGLCDRRMGRLGWLSSA